MRDLTHNLAAMEYDADDAARLGCDSVVFPEQFLTGYRGEGESSRLREEFERTSTRHAEILFFFGTISEDGVNRLCVYLGGAEVAHYDKVHLFQPNDEHIFWKPGERYVAFNHGPWRIGLATCNDVRFPEQTRALKLKCNVNLIVIPALWPWQRDHIWSTLLRARAIENGCFVVGSCVTGIDNGVERFDGAGNHVFDPLGEMLHGNGRIYELDHARLREVLVDTRSQHCEICHVDVERH
jgi:omega-amidase